MCRHSQETKINFVNDGIPTPSRTTLIFLGGIPIHLPQGECIAANIQRIEHDCNRNEYHQPIAATVAINRRN
jgi:hypothetical protein